MGGKLSPFIFSDTNKRYHTYDYHLRHRFGKKGVKIALDAGFTCPNLDGSKGYGGCSYCFDGSSSSEGRLPLAEQYARGRAAIAAKWGEDAAFLPYLQAHTNTYAPPDVLRRVYAEALALPGAAGLCVATRADALGDDVMEVLRGFAGRAPLTVELGLQTVHDVTAEKIGRGHGWAEFLDGFGRLRDAGIEICVHIIDGLPGEDRGMMLETARELARLRPDGVKIHLLYILRGTRMYDAYLRGQVVPLTREEYVETVVGQLELLPPETYVGRLTGDAPAEALAAPLWSLKKLCVMNEIDKRFVKLDTMQGVKYR